MIQSAVQQRQQQQQKHRHQQGMKRNGAHMYTEQNRRKKGSSTQTDQW